jgi:Ni/Co efflux regulator RcnB
MKTTGKNKQKIVVYGYGEFSILYYHMINHSNSLNSDFEFYVILPTSQNYQYFIKIMPDVNILNVENEYNKLEHDFDFDDLKNYDSSIHLDVDAEKRTFKHRKSGDQMQQAAKLYHVYKTFLEKIKPDYVFFAHIEGFEQKMAVSLCHELGIPAGVPVDCRMFSGSIICPDAYETLPSHAVDASPNIDRATQFVARYRERHMPAFVPALGVDERGASLSHMTRPLMVRISDFIRRTLAAPSRFEWDVFKASIFYNVGWYREAWWSFRRWRAAKWFDVADIRQLPEKFVYFPLHFSPESSINTPAPYFIDQLRVVDAIRYAMPSNYALVVKDHPAALLARQKSLMDKLRRRSGVIVVKSSASGRELIEKAAVTISVTGTSTLEAFLLGKPSLTLGGMFGSKFLGGITPIDQLSRRIREVLAKPPGDEEIVAAVAEIMTRSRPFSIFGLGMAGDPVFTENNVRNMLAALEEAVVHATRKAA